MWLEKLIANKDLFDAIAKELNFDGVEHEEVFNHRDTLGPHEWKYVVIDVLIRAISNPYEEDNALVEKFAHTWRNKGRNSGPE